MEIWTRRFAARLSLVLILLLFGPFGAPSASAESSTRVPAGPLPLVLSDLQRLMAGHGWNVVRDLDGNLLLYPQGIVAPAPAEGPAAAREPSPGPATAGDVPTPPGSGGAGRVISFEEAKGALAAYGWLAEQRADGAINLVPPRASGGVGQAPNVGTEGPTAAVGDRPPAARYASLAEVQVLVEERGWRLVSDPAGNLVLRPVLPAQGVAEKAAEATTSDCKGWAPDPAAISGLSLPVDRESEARSLADAWLRAVGEKGGRVGAVRKVNRVYVASVVAALPPNRLRNQLAIRRHDGCVYALLESDGQ